MVVPVGIWIFRIELFVYGKQREIVHKPLENETAFLSVLLPDMGDILGGDASLE